jgi:dihydroxyacetone kinase-like protein
MQFGTDQVLWAAWLYYEEGLKQDQIAEQLGISRASVFNLLQKARDEGVVTITIDPSRIARADLALKLKDVTGLEECFVLPTGASGQPLHQQIGHLGARVLENRITEDETIGVAWGRTVLALSQTLSPLQRPNVTVAQITGSSAATFDFSPVFCTSNLAERLNARCVNLHAPGVVSSAAVKKILMAEPAIHQHFALLHRCTMILFGVTHLADDTLLVSGEFMSQAELKSCRDQGAVGFASGHFFDLDGQIVTGEFDERHITMPMAEIMEVPQRICVGGGPEKVAAICGMIRARIANILVTDEQSAQAVLREFETPRATL